MSLMSGLRVPQHIIREQIASAVNIIVQIARLPGGRRAVTHIVEVDGYESEQVLTQAIFEPDAGTNNIAATGINASFLARDEFISRKGSISLEASHDVLS